MASIVKFLIGDGCLYLVTLQKGGLSRWSTQGNWKCFFVTSKISFDYNGPYTYRWQNNFHPYIYQYWLLATVMFCKQKVLEPADVVVYYWSKPTLGRTWFEVEIKILFKSFIWRHCLFKQRPLLLYQMVSAVLYIETSITCWHKTLFHITYNYYDMYVH